MRNWTIRQLISILQEPISTINNKIPEWIVLLLKTTATRDLHRLLFRFQHRQQHPSSSIQRINFLRSRGFSQRSLVLACSVATATPQIIKEDSSLRCRCWRRSSQSTTTRCHRQFQFRSPTSGTCFCAMTELWLFYKITQFRRVNKKK